MRTISISGQLPLQNTLASRFVEQPNGSTSVKRILHKSTSKLFAEDIFLSKKLQQQNQSTYSSSTNRRPNRKQKYVRHKARIEKFIRQSRLVDLPMTRAITINWERILHSPVNHLKEQPRLFRRLRLIANRRGFKTAYIWAAACGCNVGLHAHIGLYWPRRHLPELHNVFHILDPTWASPPNNIYDKEIDLNNDGDFRWGKYLAEHVNKHQHYSNGRSLGFSSFY